MTLSSSSCNPDILPHRAAGSDFPERMNDSDDEWYVLMFVCDPIWLVGSCFPLFL